MNEPLKTESATENAVPPPGAAHRRRVPRWLLALAVAVVVASLALGGWHAWRARRPAPPPPPHAQEVFELPPYTDTPYLNAGPEAQYVGTAACVECHEPKHRSYLLTTHSRSLCDLNLDVEPADDTFEHKPSGWSYRVHRDQGKMYHEEVLRTAEGKEIARTNLPITYLIGSGNFTRSYLVEVDGFLHESPITWYRSKHAWGMSPGPAYESAVHHAGFEREVNQGCLSCHTGRVEPDAKTGRLLIRDQAIGCENCHGPGSLHVALRHDKDHQPPPGAEDLTIVNPRNLKRPLLESICAQCHLNGPAHVEVRGREIGAFRPGRPLSDYHIDYRFDRGSEQMTVVGHIEQLRKSACYQKSDMTCLTCHDPHAAKKPKDPIQFYRDKCLDCHTLQSCKKPQAERLKADPADNCVACHMPRGDTDIPHISFTHHRIGVHRAEESPDSRIPDLVTTDDTPLLSDVDRRRNLGLAYLAAAEESVYPQFSDTYFARAQQLLDAVHADGLRDPQTLLGLADLNVKRNPESCKRYARQVLDMKDIPIALHIRALTYVGPLLAQEGDYAQAIPYLEELVRLRSFGDDWGILGQSYLRVNRPKDAVRALEHAITLQPDKLTAHALLAEAYLRLGDDQRAAEHRQKADWLHRHSQP
jgi:hypothetical protein